MKNHILDCSEVSCCVGRGKSAQAHFVGHFILTKQSIMFLSFPSLTDRMQANTLSKSLVRQAMARPGSVRLPLLEIDRVEQGGAPETGTELAVLTSPKLGKTLYTFRCAAFCGQESEDFEAVAYPFIAEQLRRRRGLGWGFGQSNDDSEFWYEEISPLEDERSKYCRLLEVPESASPEEIKNAYRELSMVWHPDRHPDRLKERTTLKMQELNTAYTWLTMN